MLKQKKILFFILLSITILFSCVDREAAIRSIFEEDDQKVTGVFESRAGRLDSSAVCSRSEACMELCDSMLQNLVDKERCYSRYTEKQVQGFRDVYNLLAVGDDTKLEDIDPEEMKKFMEFGPQFWRDAIRGFKTGIRNTEACDQEIGQDQESRDCERDTYYIQPGYKKEGAANALSWIAVNHWLGELLSEKDNHRGEEHSIMTALLDVMLSSDSSRGDITCTITKLCPDGSTLKCFRGDTEMPCPANLADLRGTETAKCKDGADEDVLFCDPCKDRCTGSVFNFGDPEINRLSVFEAQCLGKYNFCELAYCEEVRGSLELGSDFFHSRTTRFNQCNYLLLRIL